MILLGCSSNQYIVYESLSSNMYDSVQKKLYDRKYKSAIDDLMLLKNRYPYGTHEQKIQIDLIYAYFRSNDLEYAKILIDQFFQKYPTHPNIDFLIYIRGLISMKLDTNKLQKFFKVNRDNCNPKHAIEAIYYFSKLVHNYPHSQYIEDAFKRITILKERCARYELSIIRYYDKKRAHLAVINRSKKMLYNFPDTKSVKKAVYYMKKAFHAL